MRFKFLPVAVAVLLLTGLAGAERAVRLDQIRQLKAPGLEVLSAVWSPDGSNLALTGAKYQGISLMDVHTGRITTITQEPSAGYRLAWSPDGRYIAYKALVEPQVALKAIMLADLETGKVQQLSERSNQLGVPSWLPDGRIGFTFEDNFLIVDPHGQVMETIPDIASNIAPASPDGQWILYSDRQDAIWACHLTDGERFQVTPQGRRFFNPVWSPREPLAIVNELGGSFYLVDVIRGTMIPLDDGNHYAWSPDGEQIVYDVTEDDGHYITAADIYVMKKDGTGKTALTATAEELEMHPSWSPDGRIAFSQMDGRLFMARVNAKAPTDLRREKRDHLKIKSRR